MARPTLVVVSGPPGAGKTTLAHRLARAIPCPAVCRDELKEGMVHASGAGFEPGPGDPLTERTLSLFAELLRLLVSAEVTVVAEAAFQDRLWRHVLEPLDGRAEVRLVHCTVDAHAGWERAVQRADSEPGRRAAHGTSALLKGVDRWRAEVAAFERVSVAAPALEVDTTDGYRPAFDDVLAFAARG